MSDDQMITIDNLDEIETHIKRLSDEITKDQDLPIVDVPIYLTIYRYKQSQNYI